MHEAIQQKLGFARLAVFKKAPYYRATIAKFKFVPVEHPQVSFMGTTQGLVVYFNERWILQATVIEIASVLVHEVNHLLRRHFQRTESIPARLQNPVLLNIAADLPINVDLRAGGWTLPKKVFYPEQFQFPEKLTFEEYYFKLLKQKDEEHGCESCGGIAGNPLPFEKELDKEHGATEREVEQIIQRAQEDITEYARRQGQGDLPQGLRSYVQLKPKTKTIPWNRKFKVLLGRILGRLVAGQSRTTYKKVSKSGLSRNLVLPGRGDSTPRIVFVLDTSGSMWGQHLVVVLREAEDILKKLGIPYAWFIQADAAIAKEPYRVRLKDFREHFPIFGGGGTQFDDALKRADKLKAHVIVYLTDGEGDVTYKPRTKLLWVVSSRRTLPIGTTIHIDE